MTVFFEWPLGSAARVFSAISKSRSARKFLAALFFMGWASTAQAAIPASERQVLLDLYASTNGAGWTDNTGWNGPVGTECTWHGVFCDGTKSHVAQIYLYLNNLVGTLPSLSGLPALRDFYVHNNYQLTGSIPELSGMTALRSFIVHDNQLSGPIPSLSGLTALQEFDARANQLTGSIPSLSGLTALHGFYVSYNQLTGPIPSLSGLTALAGFDVMNNQLTGPIPSLSGLTALYGFYVGYNQLTGPIPSLSALTDLHYFRVNNNQLTGSVPAAPVTLIAGGSSLCANSLVSSGNPVIDADWVTAQMLNHSYGGVAGGNWLSCQSAPQPIIGDPTQPVTPPPVEQTSYTVNIGVVPDTAAIAEVAGTLGSATVTVQLDLSKVLSASFAADPSYNVYVAALVPGRQLGSADSMWFVKAADLGWQQLTSPIASYLQNVASDSVDQRILIEIVRNADITNLIGTEVYIGYGTSDMEMLEAKRYRGVFIVQ